MTDTNTTRITVANQKGGAGKTTDVIHTGGALAARGHDVLLVDIEYHGELTCSLGYNDLYYDTDRTTLFDVLEFDQMESMNDIIVEHEEFDILPASEKLANNKNIQTLLEAPKSRERLDMTLDELEKDYDYIIVDTPPSLNVLTDNALVATGNVVIPVIPEKLNANSLQIFTKQLSSLEQAYGDINRLAIVCNRVEQNAEHRDTIEEIKSAYSLRVFEIPKRTDLSQSIGEGVSVFGFGKENQRVEDARDLFNEIASRLTEKGWLDRLFPDTYLIIPLTAGEETVYTTHEYLIAAHVAEPMYIGYYSALSHHGLTEQIPRTVYVVTPTRAQSRDIHGVPYRVTTVTEQKFFGCEPTSIEGTTVQVSDLEKTLVDCADHPEFCGGLRELATAMRTADERGCDWGTVGEYLGRLDNGAATERIVYLADQLGIDLPAREELVASFTSGYSLLDPTRPDNGSTDSTYRLRITREAEHLAT